MHRDNDVINPRDHGNTARQHFMGDALVMASKFSLDQEFERGLVQ